MMCSIYEQEHFSYVRPVMKVAGEGNGACSWITHYYKYPPPQGVLTGGGHKPVLNCYAICPIPNYCIHRTPQRLGRDHGRYR